jgi:pimeloyl-ACP methyl ester carboxylesterase
LFTKQAGFSHGVEDFAPTRGTSQAMREGPSFDAPARAAPTLLCLHGMFGDPDNFSHCVITLAPRWQVLAPPLPIFDGGSGNVTVDDLVEHVRGLLDAQGIERAVIAGNSLGGHVALRAALRYPRRVHALILSGSSGLFERSMTRIPRRPSRQWLRGKIREVFYDDVHVTDTLVDEVMRIITTPRLARQVLSLAKSAKHDNLRGELGQVGCRTLLVWGADDVITPLDVAEEFQAHLPAASVALIARCGHAPMIERPEEYTRVVARFLERLSEGEHDADGQARALPAGRARP